MSRSFQGISRPTTRTPKARRRVESETRQCRVSTGWLSVCPCAARQPRENSLKRHAYDSHSRGLSTPRQRVFEKRIFSWRSGRDDRARDLVRRRCTSKGSKECLVSLNLCLSAEQSRFSVAVPSLGPVGPFADRAR